MAVIDPDNPELNYLYKLLTETTDSLFLTGKAGTGKSTFLREFSSTTTKNHVLLAPTGLAALNVGGQTIHSFFRLPFRPLLPNDEELKKESLEKIDSRHKRLIRNLDLIVIDEVSMVRADIIDAIDVLLRHIRQRSYLPFGGVQMLFVGDLFQIEPVVTSADRAILSRFYRSYYFFDAKVFEQRDLVAIELHKVYRQSDPRFIGLLDRIRIGRPTTEDLKMLNARVLSGHSGSVAYNNQEGAPDVFQSVECDSERLFRGSEESAYSSGETARSSEETARSPEKVVYNLEHAGHLQEARQETGQQGEEEKAVGQLSIILSTHRNQVASINRRHLNELSTSSCKFEGVVQGNFPEKNLPTDIELEIKEGAQVMFIVNDTKNGFVNGTLGVVSEVDPSEGSVEVCTESGDYIQVVPHTWENKRYSYNAKKKQVEETVLGTFEQLPLRLAWAVTIHKSQGLTFDSVRIDLSRGVFSHGQTYVALSRSRSLEGIVLSQPISASDLLVNKRVEEFYRGTNNMEQIEARLQESRGMDHFLKAAALWSRGQEKAAFLEWLDGMVLCPDFLQDERFRRLVIYKALPFLDSKTAKRGKTIQEELPF